MHRNVLKMSDDIISPFDEGAPTYNPTEPNESVDEFLDLTWENVDMVLEEMRPFLIQDGGNVAIAEIDGPVVRLQLEVRQLQGNIMCWFTVYSLFLFILSTNYSLGRLWNLPIVDANNENG